MDSNLWTISKESKEIIKKIKSLPVAPVLTFNNFKGGVGKSTLIALFAFIMVKFKIKVLLIDSDPQRTLTKKLMKNFTVKNEASQTFMEGIKNNSLKNCITQLDDYLYIVQGDWELAKLDRYARTNLKQSNEYFLYSYLINDLKKDYDFIIFDSVPTTSLYTHNCIVASDYVIAPTQAEEESYENTISYLNYLNDMRQYNEKLEILGVVPYLTKDDNSTNRSFLKKYYETFGDLTFQNIIKYSARVLTWGTKGITENQGYDKQTLAMYLSVFEEFLERINK
ncbi:ATPase for chromosome partitioning (plasmid) [Lactococcus cremoris subsp. cremoris SK11]|mgnify:FL=1|uniref:AAA family ATPase n=6 Tax=Lactococcus TaxID=1357 RepID=Q2VHI8_9LACT|nr:MULTISPECIES: ParA family protein [Lactococcus]ABA47422.1 putative plasmid partitioning ATPase [Lactococcus lactis]ABJ74088.1 ATPase for chromosome partitioning [Lactococcus cremoris subsp. cremoris SK11]ARE22070.1 ParA family protein [Lactococcus cremoris]KSU24039.1 Chromosome (plasmid) partitioning protein ParA / Sporulation initiation inhibitor protein Soj [Lactococcus lactis subsp. lactis]KZK48579.1 Chromosome (plasmid) partitioning protein ParA / Sporulation initiation inhibitor protei